MEITYPRIVHQELLTHRAFSRNSASSRAIPVKTQIDRVNCHPFVPGTMADNQPGMTAGDALPPDKLYLSKLHWLEAWGSSVLVASDLEDLGVHKQWANRLLEPFSWMTTIVTATDWDNFFDLRTAADAQPELQKIARMMQAGYNASTPRLVKDDQYHLPYGGSWIGYSHEEQRKISIGRCARVSYMKHDGTSDPEADMRLYERMLKARHMSPFEHVARPFNKDERRCVHEMWYANYIPWLDHQTHYCANLRGWVSVRSEMEYSEYDFEYD